MTVLQSTSELNNNSKENEADLNNEKYDIFMNTP